MHCIGDYCYVSCKVERRQQGNKANCLFACRVAKQEKECGLICYDTAFSVETAVVQICERETKFRTTNNPEVLLVNSLLLSMALQDKLNKYHDDLADKELRCRGTESNPSVLGIASPDTEAPEAQGDFILGDGIRPLVAQIYRRINL